MEKAILASKDVPQGFKNDLQRMGVMSGPQQVSAPNPPQYNPNLPGGPTPQDQPTNYHDVMGNPIHLDTGGSITTPTAYHDAQGNPIHLDQNGQIMDSRIIQRPPDTQASTEPAAPFYGRAAAQALPMIGSMVEPGFGTAVGTGLSTILKMAAPGTFGQMPQSVPDFAKELGVNLLTQDVAPGVLGWGAKKIASALPAVKEGTANLLSKSLAAKFGSKSESRLLEKAAGQTENTMSGLQSGLKAAQKQPSTLITDSIVSPGTKIKTQVPYGTAGSTPHPDVTAAEEAISDQFGKNSVGKQLLNLKNEVSAGDDIAKAQQYHTISDQMYSDITHVRNAKLVADPGTVAEIGYHKLLGGSEGPIDAKGILTELGGEKSEIYQEGLGSNLPAFKDAMGEIAKQQKTGPGGGVINYMGKHLVWSTVAGAGAGALGHPLIAGGVIGNAMLSRLMSSRYAPVVVAALKTPAGSPQAAVINQFMSAAIKSAGGLATTPDK
jgi:hypothetical protein